MSHGDSVIQIPDGFKITGSTIDCSVAAMENTSKGYYGLQFHPEVQHTPKGNDLLDNFLLTIGADRSWTPDTIVESLTQKLRADVGKEQVLLGISGGVDSSTLGLLLHRAIGESLHAVFVDHGLLRQGEAGEVESSLRELGVNLTVVQAAEQFLAALSGITDPEEKRKIIGAEFINVFDVTARKLQIEVGAIRFLAQGTLYPDVIESAGGHGTANIKSHHNVGGLPDNLAFDLLEPFRTLFKDEVRAIAATLGLPEMLRKRHPFPGPGLAIRCIGEVTRERLEVLRRVDHIFVDGLREFEIYDQTWQALAVLTPVRSVGVMGDDRTYAHTIALRAVSSVDGMTADWSRLPYEFLATISNRITNAVPEVNRVVYDITSKPPGTIEWE
jgi:GMP synthase (glutamine-hydrolysing)